MPDAPTEMPPSEKLPKELLVRFPPMVTVLPPTPPYPSIFNRALPPFTVSPVSVVTIAPSRRSTRPLLAMVLRLASALLLSVAPVSTSALAPAI